MDMSSNEDLKFSQNGVHFQYPKTWKLSDVEWGEDISAITLDFEESGICMIDIFHNTQAKDLESYINLQMSCFEKELPVFQKRYGQILSSTEKFTSKSGENLGRKLEFSVKTIFLFKSTIVNKFFRQEHNQSISFISYQIDKEYVEKTDREFQSFFSSYDVQG